ncbi:PPE family protein [Mycobacterium marinum]|uniref:PPE family protein n=1 Tax=Mycobacterium marinum TaxID=1781 RepID=UPI0021C2690B|nr:PPE family protein [Mycobacterium marinum]GJN98949.1 PPE family protein [Mycobacterium marinum]GJO13273.1 PPE family protein [Mycobacterium marinum]GJO17844.1 PPE family protein [Mycobacterium marinum]GJO26092.1 PPE family protein [Mycobacterium marinum]GJO36651.1 PPE family protein [Mycobacterium marinum]
MDFSLLPPEVNSARMYTGPGSGSLLAAAASWDALAAELGTTAETCGSILTGLTDLSWRGQASESMAASAAPYVGWLYRTAEQTQQAAIQARTAALAFEQAYAMTVPPPLVAANRAQLLVLIATNFFGQNTSAIAANEAQYAEMWAQDAAAMYGYATTSAAAGMLTPFSSPNQATSPAGLAAQSTAVTQANATAAATDPITQLVSSLTQSLGAIQAIPSILPDDFTILDGVFSAYATVGVTQDIESFCAGVIGAENNLGLIGSSENPAEVTPSDFGLGSLISSTAPASAASGGGLGSAVAASVGRSGSIGQLSVPPSWSAPSARMVSALSPSGLTTIPGTEEAAAAGSPGFPGMVAPPATRASGVLPRYGVRLTVMAHPPAAG